MMGKLYGLKPFLSSKGYVGLAPDTSLPDDKIVVIFGVIAPLVLREVPDGIFELFGEAYTHGIMDGEAMDIGLVHE